MHLPLTHYARSTPNRAFLLADGGVSYRQAAGWVSGVANRYLAEFAGERVAIWMAKSNDYALSILAVLYASGVYVPLDDAQPLSRARRILEDCRPRALLLDAAHYDALAAVGVPDFIESILVFAEPSVHVSEDPRVTVLSFDALSAEPIELPEPRDVSADRIAAILYTSGSTGQPKGVQLSRGNLANFVEWCGRELSLTSQDTFLNIASFNFDLSTFDLFVSLRHGAAVYVTHEADTQTIGRLEEILQTHGITVLYTVPSMLALMTRARIWERIEPLRLRRVIFAGETMPMPTLSTLARCLPVTCDLYNFYGPTETNVCLYYKVTPPDLQRTAPVPIGRPIDQTQVWLQDDAGDILPPESDQLGEIWVAGACVTPGYWHREDPKNGDNHRHNCHATGDLGRYENGELVYHGRIDRMLKLNGFRIELGEIEAVLATHPQIQEVAVVAEQKQTTRLIAYIATRGVDTKISVAELKSFCAEHLPKYMIPHNVGALPVLPKNPNGKIDYRALVDGAPAGALS
ncbi:MAG: amino acid adenylation domain-containing protein [Gammaproteobacteria bacterium]|nr:amino acid adenylation domain-containing protein [Gammaproteobacteria bacterium]